jgi:hypothetical protein
MAIDLELEVDHMVTLDLHPQVVASLPDFDEETRGELQQVVDAFDGAYQSVRKVRAIKEAAMADPTLTPAAQILAAADSADRVFAQAASKFDKVTANLNSGIKNLESELSAPLTQRAAHTISVEIRSYVRGLSEVTNTSTLDKRPRQSALGFIQAAIAAGDGDTVAAILGAPAYLSGIDPNTQATFLRLWHEKANPTAAKRIRAMQAALDLMGERSGRLHTELEKVVGHLEDPKTKRKIYPSELRQLKAQSAKAFATVGV